jgi:hypothetical protein
MVTDPKLARRQCQIHLVRCGTSDQGGARDPQDLFLVRSYSGLRYDRGELLIGRPNVCTDFLDYRNVQSRVSYTI